MTTAKITPQSTQILNRLHKHSRKPKTVLIEEALERHEIQIMLEQVNEGYARLKAKKTEKKVRREKSNFPN